MRSTKHARNSSVEIPYGDLMTIGPRMHASDQTDIVRDTRRLRKQFRKFCTALSMLGKLPSRPHQFLACFVGKAIGNVFLVVCSIKPGKFRFGVRQIHVGRPPMLKQRDHRLCFGLMMRRFWLKVQNLRLSRNFLQLC